MVDVTTNDAGTEDSAAGTTMFIKLVGGETYMHPSFKKEACKAGEVVEVPIAVGNALLQEFYTDQSNNQHFIWDQVQSADGDGDEDEDTPPASTTTPTRTATKRSRTAVK